MRLFETEKKVPVYLDGIAPKKETRNGAEITLVDLTMRVQPLSAELASCIDPKNGAVRRKLFKLNTAEVDPDLAGCTFRIRPPRQRIEIYASTDTEQASLALDQVDVTSVRARSERGVDGWALVFHCSYGPVGKAELEYLFGWYTKQAALLFYEAEPTLDFEEPEESTEADRKAKSKNLNERKAPEWEDGGALDWKPTEDGAAAAAEAKPKRGASVSSIEDGPRYARRHKTPKDAAAAKQKDARKKKDAEPGADGEAVH